MHLNSCNWSGSEVVVCQDMATNANMLRRQNKLLQDLTLMWHCGWQLASVDVLQDT